MILNVNVWLISTPKLKFQYFQIIFLRDYAHFNISMNFEISQMEEVCM